MIRGFKFVLVAGILLGAFFYLSPVEATLCNSHANSTAESCNTQDNSPVFDEPDLHDQSISDEPDSLGQGIFDEPEVFDQSVFGRVPYARLADNANVYNSPSRGAGRIRNVGDGFLFVTVNNWEEINGETWYQINFGEYVHQDDIQLVSPSDFQGVEVKQQPQRPFGWVVQDVKPSSRPDGEPGPAFEELPRLTFFQIYDAVKGEEGWLWYEIGDGRWVRQTFVSVVDVTPRPEGVGLDEFWTEVDLYEQTFAAYEGDRMVYATLISSGLNRWPTREGLFQVSDRFDQYKMSGAEGQVDYYYIEDIPYIMYFDLSNGIALHGTYWHDRFGYKHSHGCVNMPILDAEWTFYWSEDGLNDLWVWVHTSDPLEHLPTS